MSIIEKLGITLGPWRVYSDESYSITHYSKEANCNPCHGEMYSRNDAILVCNAPEMLDTLISYVIHFENEGQHFLANMGKNDIEKATGKSWEEIKALMD